MRRICMLIVVLLVSAGIRAQTVKWHYNLRDVSFGQTAARDVDGDGKLELIFCTYWNDSNVYCLNAEDGSLKWKHRQPGPGGGCNDAGPLIYDAWNNGNYKVVVPGSCMDTTFCYDADSGYVQWKVVTGGGDSPPSLCDYNKDGIADVLHGTFFGNVQCLNGRTGAINWTLPVSANAAIESEPTIIKNDTETLFAVATWDFTYDSNRIACYRAADHSLKWKYYTHNLLYHGPATGDLFRNGQKELVIGDYDGYLYCLRASDGSLVWKDSVSKGLGGYIGAPVTLADLDNDGYLDIIYMDGTRVRAVNRNDGEMWQYSSPTDFTDFRGAVVADMNNDNVKDVTFASYWGKVISLDGATGAVIRSFDTRQYAADSLGNTSNIYEMDNAPIIADFDNDGILDVFVIGGKGRSDTSTYNDYGYAFCLSWGAGKGPAWTMFRHDDRRTACLCDTAGLPLAVQETAITDQPRCTIYPNPATDHCIISLWLPEGGNISYSISDVSGRTIIEEQSMNTVHGNNTIELNAAEIGQLPAGVYIVTVRTNSGKVSALISHQ